MSETNTNPETASEAGQYEIRLKGHLDDRWVVWFGNMVITLEENGDSVLTGPLADQAALYGLLKKVRDLGIPLVSVNFVDPNRARLQEDKRSNPSI